MVRANCIRHAARLRCTQTHERTLACTHIYAHTFIQRTNLYFWPIGQCVMWVENNDSSSTIANSIFFGIACCCFFCTFLLCEFPVARNCVNLVSFVRLAFHLLHSFCSAHITHSICQSFRSQSFSCTCFGYKPLFRSHSNQHTQHTMSINQISPIGLINIARSRTQNCNQNLFIISNSPSLPGFSAAAAKHLGHDADRSTLWYGTPFLKRMDGSLLLRFSFSSVFLAVDGIGFWFFFIFGVDGVVVVLYWCGAFSLVNWFGFRICEEKNIK